MKETGDTFMRRAVLLVLFIVCSPAFAQEAMFRGNPQHTGVYNGTPLSKFSKIKWQFRTGAQVLSSPAIVNGTVYIGSSDHFLYALEAANGSLQWKFKTQGRITSSPAVSGGTVYFASFDSNFYAVDAVTGNLRWKFKTAGERRFAATHLHGAEPASEVMPDPFDFYLSSPVVWNGTVYFGSGDTNVYALDAASGALRWKFKTGDVVHASPAIDGGVLYIGSWDSYFYALDAASGKELWRFKTGEDPAIHNQVGIQSSAAVANGAIYFGCRDSKFYALGAHTGKQLWSFDNKGSWVIASPAVLQGKVFFPTSDSGLLHVVDAKSGAVLFSVDNKKWPMFSSPAIVGDYLYLGSHEGQLLAVDLAKQKIAWTVETAGHHENGSTYTLPNGFPNYGAAFVDFFYDDMVSGVQKMMSVGAVLSSPVVADRTVFFGSTDGNVYALN
jgi:outer membrane protein assembly factor BamB